MTRRQIREHIFKILFRVEFNPIDDYQEQKTMYLESIESNDEENKNYIDSQIDEMILKLEAIDEIINTNTEKWKVSRMAKVDLTILRLALFEINYMDEIPTNVSINEAIEIAKKYGGESSPSFINGILGKIIN
ncbi:NusB antitermination factor [Natranaerovirga hydrolytica]|uniref:Transcription antitermination protein NusB n=1 Tax=Natranaerovirga hydrolytica TaxID=680378 RepID=A0A4R1N5T2_9FIRM|nr:transcription antitermination factor NusB [Natranaerovirga hydrolytica]TCK98359.1 NusB antitermination factor [Natranaerovirga hydrolytica]